MENAVFYSDASTSAVKRRTVAGVCGVCGKNAQTHHYGGLCCSACRSFFLRAVQSGKYRKLTCERDAKCKFSKSKLMSCRGCRFSKCREIGMDPKWVMDETDRARWKLVRTVTSRVPKPLPDVDGCVAPVEENCVDRLISAFRDAAITTPYPNPQIRKSADPKDLHCACMLVWNVLRTARFFWKLPEFCHLLKTDADVLFTSSVLQVCLLRVAFSFDHGSKSWPNQGAIEAHKVTPSLPLLDMEGTMSAEIIKKRMELMEKVNAMHLDDQCVVILMLVICFSPERSRLMEPQKVEAIQEQMALILKKYVRWRYGGAAGVMYAKLLTLIADIQEVVDLTDERNFFPHESQVEIFQTLLGDMNPFKSYTVRRNVLSDIPDMDDLELDSVLNMLESAVESTASTLDTTCEDDASDLYDLLENMTHNTHTFDSKCDDDTTDLYDLLENVDDLFN